VVIAEPLRKAVARRIEQKARRLDRVAGYGHCAGALPALHATLEIDDSGGAACLIHLNPCHHALVTDFGSVGQGVRDVRYQG
jgi:hypothetical protein